MALQTIPGLTGYQYGRVSSLDKRAIGKLTDTNHLEALAHSDEPALYDKRIIDIYTQTSLYSNDFLTMLQGATPFYIKGNTDAWQWDIEVPYKFPKIVALTTETAALAKPGIDGNSFTIVMDSAEFFEKEIITANRMYAQQLLVTKDPVIWDGGWLYEVTLVTNNPLTDFVDKNFILPGVEYSLIGSTVGEFDQTLPGLGRLGEKITMFDSLGGGVGLEHTITSWADAMTAKDSKGQPLDILVYIKNQRNQKAVTRNDVRWEPYVEFLMRKKLQEMKVTKMIWSKPGSAKTNGSKQEVKKISAGVYHRMRNNGNLVQFNAGSFTTNIFRNVFGDLFYRRVDVADRKVKIYTNEAGFDLFDQALKDDAFNSGLTLVAGVNDKFIQGTGQKMTLNYAFNSMITRETGEITLVHLLELDLPQGNLEFGQNKKSTPLFLVFDVSPSGDGTLRNNIREVRQEGQPAMTWGYVDGRRSHLGFAASQNMQSANMSGSYTCWMEDRYDVFIEDLSRCVVIEQIPNF